MPNSPTGSAGSTRCSGRRPRPSSGCAGPSSWAMRTIPGWSAIRISTSSGRIRNSSALLRKCARAGIRTGNCSARAAPRVPRRSRTRNPLVPGCQLTPSQPGEDRNDREALAPANRTTDRFTQNLNFAGLGRIIRPGDWSSKLLVRQRAATNPQSNQSERWSRKGTSSEECIWQMKTTSVEPATQCLD